MQRRMSKPLLESIPRTVRALRMHMRGTEFFFGRDVELEGAVEGAGEVDFEDEDDEDRGDGGDPVEGCEAVLESDS